MSKSINDATKRGYDGTVARIAGNIAAGLVGSPLFSPKDARSKCGNIAKDAVEIARLIVAEVKRTEPVEDPQP